MKGITIKQKEVKAPLIVGAIIPYTRLIQTLTADIHFQQSNRLQNEHVKSAASLHTQV